MITVLFNQDKVSLPNIRRIFHNHGNIVVNTEEINNTIHLMFKIIDIHGTIVYQKRLNSNEKAVISVSNIPSGIYFGVLYSDNNLLDAEKIMIIGK